MIEKMRCSVCGKEFFGNPSCQPDEVWFCKKCFLGVTGQPNEPGAYGKEEDVVAKHNCQPEQMQLCKKSFR